MDGNIGIIPVPITENIKVFNNIVSLLNLYNKLDMTPYLFRDMFVDFFEDDNLTEYENQFVKQNVMHYILHHHDELYLLRWCDPERCRYYLRYFYYDKSKNRFILSKRNIKGKAAFIEV